MGMSGPSLLIESTDSMIIFGRNKSLWGKPEQYNTAMSECRIQQENRASATAQKIKDS